MSDAPAKQADLAHDLFIAALRKSPADRSSFLNERCGSDHALREEVASLLAHHQTSAGFLDPVGSGAAGSALAAGLALPAGACIARHRILDVLGAGGMGMVYIAQQESPRRTVALKVIRPGLASASLLRRFEHEAQVLALLQHPGIAQIYEAGTADTGAGDQPYFAMELVRGEPLTQHAKGLPLPARLELFAKVCDAVHHAHTKGVVHRDLKPSNILVDAAQQPKILDFGVARLTSAEFQASTLHTSQGQLVGTIPYMSPEQVAGQTSDIDTRSDVYALGVILYQLLSGRLPHDIERLGLPEAARAIREDEPAPLSSIDRALAGDVETIAAKALEKARERRYQSASELAADVRRYLRDEPIIARPPSAVYRVRKFAKRNKVIVASVAAIFLVLTAGIVGVSLSLARALSAEASARAESIRATRTASRARATTTFLQRMLAGINPATAKSMDHTLLRAILEAAVVDVEKETDPEVQGAVRYTIGQTFHAAGLDDRALPELKKALEVLVASAGPDSREAMETEDQLGQVETEMGRHSDAEQHFKKVLDRAGAVYGPEDTLTLQAMHNLAAVYLETDRIDEAEPLCKKVLELRRRVLGDTHFDTLQSLAAVASVSVDRGRYTEAIPTWEEVYHARMATLGQEHPSTLSAMHNLAFVYEHADRREEGCDLYERTLELRLKVLGPEHPETLYTMNNLASLSGTLKRYDRAEAIFPRLIELQKRILGEESPKYLGTLHNFAAMYLAEGKPNEAEPLSALAAAGARAHLPPDNWYTPAFITGHGIALTGMGRFEDAERELLDARHLFESARNTPAAALIKNASALAKLYTQWGKPDEAAKWRTP